MFNLLSSQKDTYYTTELVRHYIKATHGLLILQVAEMHLAENDKVKLLTLYCGDEDPAVQRAACGALAILSSNHPEKITEKISKV